MAKIEAYKFINPGMAQDNASDGSLVARKLVLGYNRLGKTLTGMGNVIKDIESIEILRLKEDRFQDKQARKRAQFERDQQAEEDAEINDLSKAEKGKVSKSRMRKMLGRSKVGGALKNALPLWAQAMMPIFEFFIRLSAIPVIKAMLDWCADEENQKKLEVFLHKLHFVTKKFYDFFNWLVGKKIIGGYAKLLGKESTIGDRISGLWDLVQAAAVLQMIFNPLSSLAFISGSIGWFLKNVTTILKSKPNAKGISAGSSADSSKSKTSANKQRLKSQKSSKGIKPRNLKLKDGKFGATRGRAPSVEGSSNLKIKPKRKFWQEGNKWLKDGAKRQWDKLWKTTKNQVKLFKAKPKANLTNLFKSTLTKGKNVLKNPLTWKRAGSVSKGVAKGGASLGIGILADMTVDAGVKWGFDRLGEKIVRDQIQKHGVEAVINDRRKKVELELGKSKPPWWHLGFTSGSKNYRDDRRLEMLEHDLEYAIKQKGKLDNKKVPPIIEKKEKKHDSSSGNWLTHLFKPKEEKKKDPPPTVKKKSSGNFWGNLFSGWGKKSSTPVQKVEKKKETKKKPWWRFGFDQGGRKLPEFIFGRIWKGVKKVASGVFNGVTKAVSSVVETVGKVASNPIVNTALSFIPGMQIPMAIVNGVQGIANGNIMQAVSGIAGGLSNFAAIGSTAQSVVNTPNWLMNLRMSSFGQGIANMTTGVSNWIGGISSGFNNFMQTDIGKLGKSVYGGLTGQGWGGTISQLGHMTGMTKPGGLFGEGGFFGEGGRMAQFGDWMQQHHLGGLGNMFPGLSNFAASIPGFTNLPGISDIFSGQFSPTQAIGKLADRQGLGGIYKSAMGLLGGGDQYTGLKELAGELGVSPETLGAIDKGKSLYERAKSVALSEEPIEIMPIIMPILQDQIVIAPEVKEKAVIVYDAAQRLMNR